MIALFIIGGILILIFLILMVSVHVYFTYDEIGITLIMKVLFIKITLLSPYNKRPKKEKTEKKEKKPKEPKKEPEKKEKKKSFLSNLKEKQGLMGLVYIFEDISKIALKMVSGILKKVVFKKFVLNIEIVGDDSSDTALTYAKICSAIYPTVNIINNVSKLESYDVNIAPNFIGEKSYYYFNTHLYLRILFVVHYAINAGLKLLFEYLKIKFKKER